MLNSFHCFGYPIELSLLSNSRGTSGLLYQTERSGETAERSGRQQREVEDNREKWKTTERSGETTNKSKETF